MNIIINYSWTLLEIAFTIIMQSLIFLFPGRYEHPVSGYKHVYFNATHQTLKIWLVTVMAVIGAYEARGGGGGGGGGALKYRGGPHLRYVFRERRGLFFKTSAIL